MAFATAPDADADADVFPLNVPVLVTNVYSALAAAGENGTLSRALNAIAQQARPLCLVVRVDTGENEAAPTSDVIGTVLPSGQKTGAQALLAVTGLYFFRAPELIPDSQH